MHTGDKHQAYLYHKADHLRFAQKTDGTALAEGTGGPGAGRQPRPREPEEPSICSLSLLRQTWDPSWAALSNRDLLS